jgi:hypothetical protein
MTDTVVLPCQARVSLRRPICALATSQGRDDATGEDAIGQAAKACWPRPES